MPIFDITFSTPSSTRRAEPPLRFGGGGRSPPSSSAAASAATRLQREPRADRVGAVAEQAGEVVRLARLVALDEERRPAYAGPRRRAGVHGGHREQERRRDRATVRNAASVSSSDCGRLPAPPPRPPRRAGRRPRRGLSSPSSVASSAQASQRARAPTGWRKNVSSSKTRADLAPSVEQAAAGAEQRAQRHHVPLAEVVDRRVRDLREALAEVREQRPARVPPAAAARCRRPSTRRARAARALQAAASSVRSSRV